MSEIFELSTVKENLIKIKQVIDLYEFGKNKRMIATKCGLSPATVADILYQNGYTVDYHELCTIEEALEYQYLLYDSIKDEVSEEKKVLLKIHLAEKEYTPNDILEKLIKDDSLEVKLAIVKRKNVSAYVLEMALNNAPREIEWAIIENKYTPDSVLLKMFRDDNIMHRMKVEILNRGNLSEELIDLAIEDKDDDIRALARELYRPF